MLQSTVRKTRGLGHCVAGVLGFALSAGAAAQTDASTVLDRQTDDAFRQVLQQPQDLGVWSKYAELLIQAGNYEGGIAALERMLLTPGASPDLRVDIAALYFRLGSHAMAEGMLREALADNRLQGDKRALAESLLADVAKRNQRSQFSGSIALGVRHQSNPTYRTDSNLVFSGGALGPVPADQRPESDTDLNVGVHVKHLYDLDRQNSATIASNFAAYVVDFRSSSGSTLSANPTKPFDLVVLDFNTGIQFKPMPADVSGLTLRPHIILTNVSAQQHQYLRNEGIGLDLVYRPHERTLFDMTLDGQRRHFANRIDIANPDQLDGRIYSLRGRITQEVRPGHQLAGELTFRSNRTGRSYYDFESQEARVTYSAVYRSPFSAGRYWTTVLWLGAVNRTYGAPDPAITPLETREDRETRFGISHTVQIAPFWSLSLAAEHMRNNANLPNARYKNTSLSGVVVRSF